MKIFDYFRKSQPQIQRSDYVGRIELPPAKDVAQKEVKSSGFYGYDVGINALRFLNDSGYGYVTSWQALRYYESIAPLATAIDLICDEIASIEPVIYDGEEYQEQGEILDLLKHPSADNTGDEFLKLLSVYKLATGNAFIVATGDPKRPPLEMVNIAPQFVSINTGSTGLAQDIVVTTDSNQETFYREEINGKVRFFNKTKDREIWHIRDINVAADSCYGKPKLLAIYYELEQHLQGSVHNLALLQKGARLSGLLTTDNLLTDEQYKRLEDEIRRTYQGSSNAGSVMIAEGGMDFQNMIASNRDMDFLNLKKSNMTAIYNRLKIPLPLINPDHMTMQNYKEAKLALYDNAVLPLAKQIYEELTLFLAPRYGLDTSKECLTYNEADIPALQLRRNEEVKLLKEIGAVTIDELRERLFIEKRGGDADRLMVTQRQYFLDDQQEEDDRPNPNQIGRNNNQQDQEEEIDDTEKAYSQFYEILSKMKTDNGERKYSDDAIREIARIQGLIK